VGIKSGPDCRQPAAEYHFLSTFVRLKAMKTIAVLISLYVLFLTALPCIDRTAEHKVHPGQCTEQPASENHSSGADHCSPFCTCNCCATSVILQDLRIIPDCFPVGDSPYSPPSCSEVLSPLTAIWQPPKIA
jgi:hypothetical protein